MMSTHTVFKDRMDETFKEKSARLESIVKKTPKFVNNDDYNSEDEQRGHRRTRAVM